MEKLNIYTLLGEIKKKHENDDSMVSIDSLCDYQEDSYIGDDLVEIADYPVDIYYVDLFDWAKENFSAIQEANEEMGCVDPDIVKQIQQAQFYVNEQYCYTNLEDMLLVYCYNMMKENNIEELAQEENDYLIEFVNTMDTNSYLPDFETIKNVIMGV